MMSLYSKVKGHREGRIFEDNLRKVLVKDVEEYIIGIEQSGIMSPTSNKRTSLNQSFEALMLKSNRTRTKTLDFGLGSPEGLNLESP